MLSLPDFDLNKREKINDLKYINRATKGVYEFGSVFKTFTIALALELKLVDTNTIIENIPKLPGIYIMKDSRSEILYIGKAKILRNRVRSYFQNSRTLHPRTRIFLGKVHDIKFLTTKTEAEALILESNFIKKHQPRYNVLLKDDKHYPGRKGL